jgi:hypothetical protein
VIQGARATVLEAGLLEAASFDAAIAALREWSRYPAAAIWYAIAWAEGRRAVVDNQRVGEDLQMFSRT